MRPSKHWKPCKHCGIPQCGPGNLCVMCAVIQAVEWGYREPKPSPYQKALARLRQEMREAAARRWGARSATSRRSLRASRDRSGTVRRSASGKTPCAVRTTEAVMTSATRGTHEPGGKGGHRRGHRLGARAQHDCDDARRGGYHRASALECRACIARIAQTETAMVG